MVPATVEDVLRRRIGLDPDTVGAGLVARAVRARMVALGIADDDRGRYLSRLVGSEAEVQALVEEVVVPESWFFRDEQPFAYLADEVAAGWMTDRGRPPLRGLSAPCAGGEEPYSVAIALLDRGLPAGRFHVDAVDVSRNALAAARGGVYTANAFRSRDLAFRDRHFLRGPGGAFALTGEARGAVTFHEGNLLDPGLLADRPPYDVIFCRNLLIYLDDESRRRVLAHLDRLLVPSGVLFVGHADPLGVLRGRFRPVGGSRTFAFRRSAAAATEAPAPARAAPPRRASPVPPLPRNHPPAEKAPEAPAPAVVTDPADALREAGRLADLGRHDEAAALCEREMRRAGPSPAALFLLGLVRQAAGDRQQAERCFEKAVYLDPGHADSLVALALIAQRRGDLAAAANYRRRAGVAHPGEPPR